MKSQRKKWQDIGQSLGFPCWLNLLSGEIKFKGIRPRIYIERRTKDLKRVWSEPIPPKFEDKIIHRIYRHIGDSLALKKADLKLDVTVLLPGAFSGEFIKTIGHHHLRLRKNSIASPDFYQLVFGKGIILIQKEIGKKIIPYIIYPKLFQPIFIPPECAHATINIGPSPVVFQNICTRTPHLDYKLILKRKGMAYFIKKGRKNIIFSPNPYYLKNGLKVEKIRKVFINFNKNLLKNPLPFYNLLQTNLSQLKFLTQPKRQKYTIKKLSCRN